MGIHINMVISKSVTEEEWRQVYEETLQLIKHFPFAERRKVLIHGVETICLVPTEEREKVYRWSDGKPHLGWQTEGDNQTLKTGEDYYLPRDLVKEDEYNPEAGDALLGVLPAYMDYDWEDERVKNTYHLWGAKTQGEPYHIYLLAVAALIEARLGEKAFTYGDITRGQFKRAVEIANKYLSESIDIPDRCDMKRLLKRVSKFPMEQEEKIAVFEEFYLGTQDKEFGECFCKTFDAAALEEYWKKKFKNKRIGTVGFNERFNQYLEWGFSLGDLCRYVNYEDEDGELKYEAFVKRVMDAKLHLMEKNCEDPLKIDQEEERPYSVATLFAQFFFAGAKNKKVDRYIPLEEIRRILVLQLGDKCDVNEIINQYMEEEKQTSKEAIDKINTKEELKEVFNQDPAEAFQKVMNQKKNELMEQDEMYDISEYEDLIYYEDGDCIDPAIEKSIANLRNLIDETGSESKAQDFLKKEAADCYRLLQEMNRHILIRDTDWEKIYSNIEKDRKSFLRYYGVLRVNMTSNNIVDMCMAVMINDELYLYSEKLKNEVIE